MNFNTHKWLLTFCLSLLILKTLPARESLQKDIADGYLDDYSKVEAAFILSGATNPDSLQKYIDWYDQLLVKVKTFPMDFNNPVGSAQTVFMYLHSAWLKTYAKESTTLIDIVRHKEFNCVAATILYNLICEDLNWSCEAFETPTHVYTIFSNFQQKLLVENTSSMGFNIMKNLKTYSRYLAQFYPNSEVLRIGLDRLYYHENSNGRVISNTELLGLLAYNRAYLAKKNKNYKAAYDFVLLAQQFNRDSRSNINFEIGLYYSWGKQLFKTQDFNGAFKVFAGGLKRYPRNEDFAQNSIAAFYNALQINWQKKDWPHTINLLDSITELDILQDEDYFNIKKLLLNWQQYFKITNNTKSAKALMHYLEIFGS